MKWYWYLKGLLFPYKTKAYRRELYKKMLDRLNQRGVYVGFCSTVDFVERKEDSDLWKNLWRLPELYFYKPSFSGSSYGNPWWDTDENGMRKRRRILLKISKSKLNAQKDEDPTKNQEPVVPPLFI